jgi:hypothetical protein
VPKSGNSTKSTIFATPPGMREGIMQIALSWCGELDELEELRELKRVCVCENKKTPNMAKLVELEELPRKMQDELWWNLAEFGGIAALFFHSV